MNNRTSLARAANALAGALVLMHEWAQMSEPEIVGPLEYRLAISAHADKRYLDFWRLSHAAIYALGLVGIAAREGRSAPYWAEDDPRPNARRLLGLLEDELLLRRSHTLPPKGATILRRLKPWISRCTFRRAVVLGFDRGRGAIICVDKHGIRRTLLPPFNVVRPHVLSTERIPSLPLV